MTRPSGRTTSRPKRRSAAKPAAGIKKSEGKVAARLDPAVTALMENLSHPFAKEIESVRKLALAVSPDIREEVKWNSASYRTIDYFATVNHRWKEGVQLVFHTGAKTKTGAKALKINDPSGLVRWLAKDRCLVTLGAGKTFAANRTAFQAIVRAWIAQV